MTTNEIKFHHKFSKLYNQKTAKLLTVEIIGCLCDRNINNEFLKYDTHIIDDKYYNIDIKSSDLWIRLVFIGNKGIPFATLRKYSDEKLRKCKDLINKTIDIKIVPPLVNKQKIRNAK